MESQQYITDPQGNRVAVIIGIEEYAALLEAAEELEDIRAFDEARASGEEAIPLDKAIEQIEQSRRELPC